jgi:arylsulfatase A-like enzyme
MSGTGTRPPNFVLFITDQHRADFLGCYGNTVVRTPQIDAIAGRGTVFDRFYVASPVCMPNRASLMTGRMPSVHGVRSNGIPLSLASVTFADLLGAAGYDTGLIGKSHLQNITGTPAFPPLAQHPPSHRAPAAGLAQAHRDDRKIAAYAQEGPAYWADARARVKTPYYGFTHVELVNGHGDDLGGDYLRWALQKEPKVRSLIGPKNGLPHSYSCPQAHRTAVPEELYSTAFIGERAVAFLDRHDHADSAPFFMMVSFPDPHHPFNPPGKYWDMYKPDDFPIPEAYRRNDWMPPPHVASRIAERERGLANLNGVNSFAVSAREAQEARALTAGMITFIDDTIGLILERLARSRSAGETVVLFTSDHGDHLGDHRLLLKGAEQYESIVRVPFVWSDPTAPSGALRSASLASTIDIPATILDRAGLQPYAGFQGRSLLPGMRERGETQRDEVLIQYDHQRPDPSLGKPPRVHSIIDRRWRLSVYDGADWGELYDLERDPGEFTNLWHSAAHATVRSGLFERLARAEIEHVDRVPLPTGLA